MNPFFLISLFYIFYQLEPKLYTGPACGTHSPIEAVTSMKTTPTSEASSV